MLLSPGAIAKDLSFDLRQILHHFVHSECRLGFSVVTETVPDTYACLFYYIKINYKSLVVQTFCLAYGLVYTRLIRFDRL